MAYQSTWYFTDIPEEIVDLIEKDVSEKFDEQMADSKLHGDALNKDCLLYTSPSPRDVEESRMPSSA